MSDVTEVQRTIHLEEEVKRLRQQLAYHRSFGTFLVMRIDPYVMVQLLNEWSALQEGAAGGGDRGE